MGVAVPGQQGRALRPQPQSVHDGRGELREGTEERQRHDHRRDAADDGRRGLLRVREPQRRPRQPGGSAATAAATTAAAGRGSAAAGTARRGRREERPRGAGQRHLGARLEPVRARAPRRAEGQGSLGDQPARQSEADPRDVSLRDARRGEHAAVGNLRLRREDEGTRQGQGRSLQGSDRHDRQQAAAPGRRRGTRWWRRRRRAAAARKAAGVAPRRH